MKRVNNYSGYFSLLTILVLNFSLHSQISKDDKEKIDVTISDRDVKIRIDKIKNYEYGQSRENLTMLSNLLQMANQSPQLRVKTENYLIGFLETDATLAAKQFVCESLSIYGSDQSIPVLERMLHTPETAVMALYALERIGGERSDNVMRDAISEAAIEIKANLIRALGKHGDNQSVEGLIPMIRDSNKVVASAAIYALGKIGGKRAASGLGDALPEINGDLRMEVIDAYLNCAYHFLEAGDTKNSVEIYKNIYNPEYAQHVRYAALRGMIFASPGDASGIIVEQINSGNEEYRSIALQLVKEIPRAQDISGITKAFPDYSAQQQAQLLVALAGRTDQSSLNAMLEASRSDDTGVRIAALNALGQTGNSSTVHLLCRHAANSIGNECKAARNALYRLNEKGVDDAVIKLISTSDDPVKIELIRGVSERRIKDAVSVLFEQMENENIKIRTESIKALKDVSTPDEMDQLMELLVNAKTDQEVIELKKTISAALFKSPEEGRAAKIIARFNTIGEEEILAPFLELLGKTGDPAALPILKIHANSDNTVLKKSSIRAYSDWPNSGPKDELYELAKSSTNQIDRTLALRGYIRLVGLDEESSCEDVTNMYENAMKIAENTNEKRMALSALSDMDCLSALQRAAGYLDESELKHEAQTAVVAIAYSLDSRVANEALPILKKIQSETMDEELGKRAARIISDLTGLKISTEK